MSERSEPEDEIAFIPLAEKPRRHPHSMQPDMDSVDPAQRSPAVNALIAYDLAKRAEQRADPYEGLAEMYRFAEIAWVKGEFSLTPKGKPASGRTGIKTQGKPLFALLVSVNL